MEKLAAQVREFMQAAGQRIGSEPGDVRNHEILLGLDLIREEWDELNEAIAKGPSVLPSGEALAVVADSIGDLLYVVTWLGLAFGLPLPEVLDEIHRANMAKFGPGARKAPGGKQLKPPGWQPPNIAGILARHGVTGK